MKKWAINIIIVYVLITLLVISNTKVNGSGGHNRSKMVLGGRSDVKDVKSNKEVQELGKFSVQEYNRNLQQIMGRDGGGGGGGEGPLRFWEVVEAQRQVVSGIKYYLKVAATMQNGLTRTFDAVVVVKPWVHSKQLLNFGPSTH